MPADHEEQEHRPISERGPMLLSEQALHGIATSQSLEHAAMRLIIEEGRVKDPKYYSEW